MQSHTYTTSRDYDLLLKLMPHHRLVCFADYRFPSDFPSDPPARDVCATRYEAPGPESKIPNVREFPFLAAQARGICYAGGLHLSPEQFQKDCQKFNLEFILPASQPLRAGDTVHHLPTGEDWTLANDEENGKVSPSGWPESIAEAKDCIRLTTASETDRIHTLQEWAKEGLGAEHERDHRTRTARRQLEN